MYLLIPRPGYKRDTYLEVINVRLQPPLSTPPFRGCSRADFVTEGMPRKSETTRKRNRPDDGSHADLESNKLFFHSLSLCDIVILFFVSFYVYLLIKYDHILFKNYLKVY